MRVEWFEELWHYRELFYFFVWRDIKIRYKQTLFGVAWAVIQPFFTMIVFTLFFGRLAKMPSDGIPYPVFSYSALLPWIYFSGSLSLSGNSLISNSNLITKVYFPRIAVPASSVLCGLVDFCIASIVLVGMMIYFKIKLSWEILLWPILIVPLILLAFGVGMFLAALNVKYRDIKYAVPFFVQLWLFMTPVIYPSSIIPEKYRFLTALNPVSGVIEAFRASLIPTIKVDWQMLMISFAIILVIFFLGLFYFKKVEKFFADIV